MLMRKKTNSDSHPSLVGMQNDTVILEVSSALNIHLTYDQTIPFPSGLDLFPS